MKNRFFLMEVRGNHAVIAGFQKGNKGRCTDLT